MMSGQLLPEREREKRLKERIKEIIKAGLFALHPSLLLDSPALGKRGAPAPSLVTQAAPDSSSETADS